MRPRWIILGLLLAGIVYGLVIWLGTMVRWPERPLWTKNLPMFSQVLSFSEDGKSIFVVEDRRNGNFNDPMKLYLSRWDAPTGILFRETQLKLSERFEPENDYEISPDGTALIVTGASQWLGVKSHAFYVIDTITGQKLFGPILCSDGSLGRTKFSRNGSWIAYPCLGTSKPSNDGGIKVIDSKSGDVILHVKNTERNSIIYSCFSPEGSSIALLEKTDRGSTLADFSIRIFDLPEGKERNRIPLAKRDWQFLWTWEGNM